MEKLPLIGCIFALIGNIAISVALNIQKWVHNKSQSGKPEYAPLPTCTDHHEPQTPVNNHYLKSPMWWLGMALLILGEMGNFLAYGYAPAIFVAPLGTISIICNAIIAPIILHERIHRTHVAGILFAMVGTCCVLFVSSTANPTDLPGNVSYTLYLVQKYGRLHVAMYLTAVVLGIIGMTIFIPVSVRKTHLYIDLSILALYGGLTVVSTRGLSTLLSSNFKDATRSVLTYILAGVAGVTSVLQVKHLNFALANFDVVRVIPMQFVLFTLCTTLSSAVVYDELATVTAPNLLLCAFGGLLMFIGVFLISKRLWPNAVELLVPAKANAIGAEPADFPKTSSATLFLSPSRQTSVASSNASSRRNSFVGGQTFESDRISFPSHYARQNSAQLLLNSLGTHESRRLELLSIVSSYSPQTRNGFAGESLSNSFVDNYDN